MAKLAKKPPPFADDPLPRVLREALTSEKLAKLHRSTPEAMQAAQSFAQQRQRESLWLLWRRVPAWSVEQATFLLAGVDPNLAELPHAQSDQPKGFALHKARVVTVCATLLPSRRHSKDGVRRYKPIPLVDAAADGDMTCAQQIKSLYLRADQVKRAARGLTASERRSDLVVRVARGLVARGVGHEESDGIHLPMTSKRFVAEGVRLFPEERRLLICSPLTLRRARLSRRIPSLPAIHLAAGRPSPSRR